MVFLTAGLLSAASLAFSLLLKRRAQPKQEEKMA
jgi:hypothetical protein